MKRVLIDTCIWFEVLRRSKNGDEQIISNLKNLIEESRAVIIGPIRQEILSGIKNHKQFDSIKSSLEAFDDIEIKPFDYELAAILNNKCRTKCVQGSHTDFLICAVAINNDLEIFSTDKDFLNYKKYTGIKIFKVK